MSIKRQIKQGIGWPFNQHVRPQRQGLGADRKVTHKLSEKTRFVRTLYAHISIEVNLFELHLQY